MHSENAGQKIRLILSKIIEEYDLGLLTSSVLSLRMDGFLKDVGVDRFLFLKVLAGLKTRGLVTSFLLRKGSKVRSEHDDKQDFDTCGIGLGIDFRNRAEQYLSELSKEGSNKNSLILYLDEKGNFWHGNNKEDFCYKMGKDTIPHKILRFLVESDGLQNTEKIASILGNKKKKTVMNDIGEMRAKIKLNLQLDDVIKNERPDGYCIDPKYKIVITK